MCRNRNVTVALAIIYFIGLVALKPYARNRSRKDILLRLEETLKAIGEDGLLGPRRIVLHDNEIEESGPYHKGSREYGGVDEIHEDKEHVHITLKNNGAYILPRQMIESAKLVEFLSVLRGKIKKQ